jgi:hypothetical protein
MIIDDAVGTDGNIEGLERATDAGTDGNRGETRGELQRLFCVLVLLGGRASTESAIDGREVDRWRWCGRDRALLR